MRYKVDIDNKLIETKNRYINKYKDKKNQNS